MESDLISRQAAIDLVEDIETRRLKGEVELIYAPLIKGLRALPSAQPLTDEDYIELHDRFGAWVEEVVRDMISGEGKRWGNERRHDQQTGGDSMGKN